MGFLRRLFGDRQQEALEAGDVRTLLASARGDEGALRRLGSRYAELFGHGGELHAAFRDAWHDSSAPAPTTPPEALMVARWDDFDDPSVGDVVALAGAGDAPFVLVRGSGRARGGAGGELEALWQLEHESDVALTVIGELDVLLRRTFLVSLELDERTRAARDVLPELSDLAKARGLRTTFVPA